MFIITRFGGPYDRFLDIEKLFDPSNGGLIDMVQLPDIFLDHPTVRVQVQGRDGWSQSTGKGRSNGPRYGERSEQ